MSDAILANIQSSKSENDNLLGLPTIASRTLTEDVITRLRQAILNGQLPPSARLREQVLAKTMGISRGPIRQALIQLEHEGLVIINPFRGAYVARLTRADLDEVYSLRLALERLAIERAANRITQVELDEMDTIIQEMNKVADGVVSERETANLDVQFHEIIYRAAEHQRLYECWNQLKTQIHILLLMRNVSNVDFREMVVKSHQEILKALSNRDTSKAVTLIEEHITTSYKRVVEGYQQNNRK
ncbi:MAG: GntR family transcriptional regulator [Anaerolineae bacterium]|nr:GntR family transcriptional regulator [Anaerolineae bacterium]